ncbi:membrane protein implicated in regulation of membrane protease activity [Staphylococcus epidermidis]
MNYDYFKSRNFIYRFIYFLVIVGFIFLLFDFVVTSVCIYIFASIILVIFNLIWKKYILLIISFFIVLSLIFYLLYSKSIF